MPRHHLPSRPKAHIPKTVRLPRSTRFYTDENSIFRLPEGSGICNTRMVKCIGTKKLNGS
jgi:hypothetical protein